MELLRNKKEGDVILMRSLYQMESILATDYLASFKACLSLHKKVFLYGKTSDLHQVIDTCNKNFSTLRKLATLFRQSYRYAISKYLCDKNYSSYIDIKKYKSKNSRS